MPYKRKGSPYYWVSLTDSSGRRTRRSTETASKREAEALEARWKLEFYREKQWGEEPAKPAHTFDQLMLDYIEATADTKRSAERDIYSTKHLTRFFTGQSLESITTQRVRQYVSERQRDDDASMGTVKREIGLLSSAINHARREWGWSIPNNVQGLGLKAPESRDRWLQYHEADRLIEAAGRDDRAELLPEFITLALHTGMRKGEILEMEWSRVDLQANLLYLKASAHHQKNGKSDSIPLNRTACEVLVRLEHYRHTHDPGNEWLFFHSRTEGTYHAGDRIQNFRRSFATACRRAGITDFRPHDLRHTCATWLIQAGVSVPKIQKLLRHSDIHTTMRYAHLAPDAARSAVAYLDAIKSQSGHTGADETGE